MVEFTLLHIQTRKYEMLIADGIAILPRMSILCTGDIVHEWIISQSVVRVLLTEECPAWDTSATRILNDCVIPNPEPTMCISKTAFNPPELLYSPGGNPTGSPGLRRVNCHKYRTPKRRSRSQKKRWRPQCNASLKWWSSRKRKTTE